MADPLKDIYGNLFIVRAPAPATCNKAGANYKSEVTHTEYSPRRAYGEWLSICDAIVACGGDAVFAFEAEDEPFLDHQSLRVDGGGNIFPEDSRDSVGHLDQVFTGRVFSANGPWVTVNTDGDAPHGSGGTPRGSGGNGHLRAVMPKMLAHRGAELSYYETLLADIAQAGDYTLTCIPTPDSWEGMADVAAVGEQVVLTYAVAGHYDQGIEPKSQRSSRAGVAFAADAAGIDEAHRIYAELIYPHFHGDTVHFCARPTEGRAPVLMQYPGGLWGDGANTVASALGAERVVPISRDDAVVQYAGNSRQVGNGVLVPDGVSEAFLQSLTALGLTYHRVQLYELFGKAGGGPACATLYLPSTLTLPAHAPMRYSVRRDQAYARRERIADTLKLSPEYFAGRTRG